MSAGAFAILGALAFGFNGIVVRRAVLKIHDATIGILISVPLGVLFFIFVLTATGQVSSVANFS